MIRFFSTKQFDDLKKSWKCRVVGFYSKNWSSYLWMLFWQFVLLEFHFLCRRVNVSLETYPYHIILQMFHVWLIVFVKLSLTHFFFLSDLPCSEWLNVSLIVVHQRFVPSTYRKPWKRYVSEFSTIWVERVFLAVLNFLQFKLKHTTFEGVFSCFHGQKKFWRHFFWRS